jgi:DNA-binding transcriptional LysR family regulator
MREKHPAAVKKWTLAEYAKWESVVVSLIGDGRSDIDACLAKAGLTRRISLSTPHFTGCLAVVAATDMITTTSHLVATRYAKAYRLAVRDPPFPEVRFNNTITTSALRMNDPVIRWFRALVKEVFLAVQHRVLHSRAPQ